MLSDRNKRRLAKKSVLRRATSIRSGRVAQLPARPEMDEVFRLDDDGTGSPLFFAIPPMRAWAKANLEIKSLGLEPERAMRFIERGQVEMDHIMKHTVRHLPEPLLVCRDASGPGEDAIVDGAHRYVAATMGAAMISTKTAGYDAYVLTPDQWHQFAIPAERMAKITRSDRGV